MVTIDPALFTENQAYLKRSVSKPPKHCPRVRRWRVWYEPGDYEHGTVYKATSWHAQSPAGDRLEATGWDDLIKAIDEAQDLIDLRKRAE